MFYPERIRSIKLRDYVLEIGPGSNPHPRADIFLDRSFDEDEAIRQAGNVKPAVTQKKTIYYEDYPLPFKDKEFDYVICSHVLEHITEIDKFVSELCRIAKRGYLEFPTIYYDYLHNFDVHKTFLLFEKGVLTWMLKEETTLNDFKSVQRFFYTMLESGIVEWINKFKCFFFQGFEWEGEIILQKTNDLNGICFSKEFIISNIRLIETDSAKSLALKSRIIKIVRSTIKKGSIKMHFFKSRMFKLFVLKRLGHKKTLVFKKEFNLLLQQSNKTNKRFQFEKKDWYQCLNDKTDLTTFDAHYIYHSAWATRILKKINPTLHTDISSSLHFCSIASAFFQIEFYDYRPAPIFLSNLKTKTADLTQLFFNDNSIQSLSCMHTVEHIGLGRYGDPIDYDGDLKAINELKRVLAFNGNLLFVVPIGKPKILFNAHRIYSYEQVLSYFNDLNLVEFSLIPDNAFETGMIQNATEEICNLQNYACGCFWFKKLYEKR